jgi:hypothetical protein
MTVQWLFAGNPKATDIGKYKLNLIALAVDNHIYDLNTAIGGPVNWNIINGLPFVKKETKAGEVPHPNSVIEIDFKATAPIQLLNLNIFEIDGFIHTSGNANTVPPNPGNHGPQAAGYTNTGNMEIPSGTVTGASLISGQRIIPQPQFMGKGPVGFGVTGKGIIRDPIIISLDEIETGIIINEELFSLEATFNQSAEVSWDSINGIIIKAPIDGASSVSIYGGTNSSWVTSGPGLFSLTLSNGIFSTSGALNSTYWNLTFDGTNVVGAKLAPQYIPDLNILYTIPSSLLSSDNHYVQTLNIDAEIQGIENTVPEPSSTLLLGLGLSTMIIARNRIISS